MTGEQVETRDVSLRVVAVMSMPRLGFNASWMCITQTVQRAGMTLWTHDGYHWGHSMNELFRRALRGGFDAVLALDYDSMFLPEHLDSMLRMFVEHEQLDVLAPLQLKRGKGLGPAGEGERWPPLLWAPENEVEGVHRIAHGSGVPVPAASAHFGLTLVRTRILGEMYQPWFRSVPGPDGGFGKGRLDDDMFFWRNLRECGGRIAVNPDVVIGHNELRTTSLDRQGRVVHVPVEQWEEWERAERSAGMKVEG